MRTQARALAYPTILSFGDVSKKSCHVLITVVGIVCFRLLLIGRYGIEEYQPKHSSTTKRWAVMMVGAGRSYMLTRESFLKNVVNQPDPPMDVFVFTKNISNSSCFAELESLRLLEIDSAVIHFDINHLEGETSVFKNTEDRFVRQHTEAFQMINDYAEKQHIKYDFIFYARPDLYYTLPLNISKLEYNFTIEKYEANGTIFSPGCCAWGGWCDQLAAAPFNDFARMIQVTRDWFSRGDNTVVEQAFKARGQFANLSNFDLGLKVDYGFLILRLLEAKKVCQHGGQFDVYWTDAACNNFAPLEFKPTFKMCEILNISSVC